MCTPEPFVSSASAATAHAGRRIREASPADAAALAEIVNSYIGDGSITFDMQPKTAEFFLQQLAALQPREACIVLEDDGPAGEPQVRAYGLIKLYSDRQGYATTGETSVYVHPEHRRSGYGSAVKTELIRRCRELGYHHLVARIVAGNASSLEYNLRCGYEVVGTMREAGRVDGRWYDVTILQLLLD